MKRAPTMAHTGRCLARCSKCGTGSCRCQLYLFARTVGEFRTCECGHTQQIHESVEVKGHGPSD